MGMAIAFKIPYIPYLLFILCTFVGWKLFLLNTS